MCGGRTADVAYRENHYEILQKKPKQSCKEVIAPYIIDPFNKYKVAWDMLIGMIYLVTLILDPLILAFNFKPLIHE